MNIGQKAGIFSFFSGAGFLDLGFETLDAFQILFVNEFYPPFMEAYKFSRQEMGLEQPLFGYNTSDIKDIGSDNKLKTLNSYIKEARATFGVVGFIGGPPCPDFSIGGKNRGQQGENGQLSGYYIDLICKTLPDFFLFENVKGLWRTKRHRQFYEILKMQLIQSGYCLTERLINSLEYGVPQDRERIILIGFRISFLQNTSKFSKNEFEIDKSFPWLKHIKYSLEDIYLQPWPSVTKFQENSVLDIPVGIERELTVEFWFDQNQVDEHPNSTHCFKPRAGITRFETVAEGDDSRKSFKRLHRWRYSPTARIKSNTYNSKSSKGHKHLLWLPNKPHSLGQIAETKTEQVISEIPSQSAIYAAKIVINRYKKTAQYFIEDLGNGIELEMVLIPGGSFIMGSPEEELESTSDERPQHEVTIKPFCFGKYPVTQAQWQAVAALPQVNQELKPDPSRFKGANRPVEKVSWHDAVEFCARLSNHTQRPYRLPSEAEWEYACRAGTTTPFHFGETITTELANYDGNFTYGNGVKGVDRGETTEVGSFKIANEFGLYDMHGNVWEWCQDDWHNGYKGASTDSSAWVSDESRSDKVLRGGSWSNNPGNCRSARRISDDTGFDHSNLGFRVVCGAAWIY